MGNVGNISVSSLNRAQKGLRYIAGVQLHTYKGYSNTQLQILRSDLGRVAVPNYVREEREGGRGGGYLLWWLADINSTQHPSRISSDNRILLDILLDQDTTIS